MYVLYFDRPAGSLLLEVLTSLLLPFLDEAT